MIVKFDDRIKYFVVQKNKDDEPFIVTRSQEFIDNIDKYIIDMIFKDIDKAEQFVREFRNEQNLKALRDILLLNDEDIKYIKEIEQKPEQNEQSEVKDKLPDFEDLLL